MATDTAFAVALIVMMGARVPVELRIFLTAAAIVDDIGAIVVVALFYSGDLQFRLPRRRRGDRRRARAAQSLGRLPRAALRRCSASRCGPACTPAACTRRSPACVLALFIPTRPPPNLNGADDAGRHDPQRRRRATATKCCATDRRCRRCARSTRSTTASNRRPTACCGTSSRGRATSCCRCSRSPMRASR